MPKDNFRLLMVAMVFLALLILWAWPEGLSVNPKWGADPQSSR
jgi:hypothetical protein